MTVLEITCDESGYEGEKLIGTTTTVFAHASVHLSVDAAGIAMRELRRRIQSPATQYKAIHLLRERHRPVLAWVLGPTGPLLGNAHVFLLDKAFHLVGKVLDLLVGDGIANAGTLYRDGRRAFGPERWEEFLVAANDLMRVKERLDPRTSVDAFFDVIGGLRLGGAPARLDELLELLGRARSRAEAFRARLLDEPGMISTLDPLIPAIVRAVAHWGAGGDPVAIAHDRQRTLSPERIAQLKQLVGTPNPGPLGHAAGTRLASLSLVAAESDLRVQLADIVAGTVRKIASDELAGHGDPELIALLRPYVDAHSVWGDDRSWSLLAPAPR